MDILPMKSDTCQLLSVDFGSTSIKVARFSVSQNGDIGESAEGEWIDYTPDTETTAGIPPFHLLTPAHLDELLHTLHTRILAITPQEQSPHNPLVIVSGLTNTLAITYKGNTALLLDDPSLTTYMTREEEIIISRTCGANGLRSASSLMKLLSVKKHPEILATIFGSKTPITWDDVTFSTILSVVTGFITASKQRYTIPFDDVRAFGTRTLTHGQTIALLDALHILPSKFAIAPSRTIKTPYGLVYQINDFQAEAALVSRLFEVGLIPQTAFVISLDTVGKIMTKYLPWKKTIADLSYETIRNSGRVVKTWIKTLIHPQSQLVLYEEMERILTQNPIDRGYRFYPSVTNASEGLLIAPDGSRVHFEDIRMIPQNDAPHAIVAVARGVGWEMRRIMETCLSENSIQGGAPIVLYGGLTGHNQHGFIDILSHTLPTTQGLYTLPLTNGTLAAVVSALADIPSVPNSSLSFSLTKITKQQSEEKNYSSWLSKRPED
jgi:hypothetical protein